MKRKMRSDQAVGGIIALCAGVALVVYGAGVLSEAWASAAWPHAEGVITESRTIRKYVGNSDGKGRLEAEIRYRYRVAGIEYHGERVTFSDPFNNRQDSPAWVRAYPKGMRVRVFHDPQEPFVSTLQSGTTWRTWSPVGLGSVLVLVGLGALGRFVLWKFHGRDHRWDDGPPR